MRISQLNDQKIFHYFTFLCRSSSQSIGLAPVRPTRQGQHHQGPEETAAVLARVSCFISGLFTALGFLGLGLRSGPRSLRTLCRWPGGFRAEERLGGAAAASVAVRVGGLLAPVHDPVATAAAAAAVHLFAALRWHLLFFSVQFFTKSFLGSGFFFIGCWMLAWRGLSGKGLKQKKAWLVF